MSGGFCSTRDIHPFPPWLCPGLRDPFSRERGARRILELLGALLGWLTPVETPEAHGAVQRKKYGSCLGRVGSLGPPLVPLYQLFGWEASPTKIDESGKSWYPYSNSSLLERLVVESPRVAGGLPGEPLTKPQGRPPLGPPRLSNVHKMKKRFS